jgi:hypothetical protein
MFNDLNDLKLIDEILKNELDELNEYILCVCLKKVKKKNIDLHKLTKYHLKKINKK